MTPRWAVTARRARVRERVSRYAISIGGPIVVDASIAALWFANEPNRWKAERLLETESLLLAPDLMAVETANVWWKKLGRREMDRSDVEQAVTNLLALDIVWTSSTSLLRTAARLAIELQHPVYDCLYLTLAASRSASLATADDRLRRGAERLKIPTWSAS